MYRKALRLIDERLELNPYTLELTLWGLNIGEPGKNAVGEGQAPTFRIPIDIAMKLEGTNRNVGTHAAAGR